MPTAAGLQPLCEDPLPDPYVHRENGEWHVFGTGQSYLYGTSLRPGGLRRAEIDFDFGTETRVQDVWAFMPHRSPDGNYHGYGALNYGQFQTVIAHFLPAAGEVWNGSAIRRWKLDRILLGDLDQGRTTYYDPRVFTGEDGRLYMMYSASPAHHRNVQVSVRRMLDAGSLDPSFKPRALLRAEGYRSEDRNPGYIQLVEGANLARVEDKYVLLYSVGDFTLGNYKLGMAFSETLIPAEGQTYRKALMPDPWNVWKNSEKLEEVCYLLQSEHKGWPNYCGHVVRGPGLGNIVKTRDEYRVLFHGYRPDDRRRNPRHRYVWSLPLTVDIRAGRPMSQWLRPVLPR